MIAGLLWCAFLVIMMCKWYSPDNPLRVFEIWFHCLLSGDFVAIFHLIFLMFGLGVFIIGARNTMLSKTSKAYGDETFGVVTAISPTKWLSHNKRVWNLEIKYINYDGLLTTYKYRGTLRLELNKGDMVALRHYQKHITILRVVTKECVPEDVLNKIEYLATKDRVKYDKYGFKNHLPNNDTPSHYGDRVSVSQYENTSVGDKIIINGIEYKRQN